MQSLDLNKKIQVKTGDYRRKWVDAKVVYVRLDDVCDCDDDEIITKGISFGVKFLTEDGQQYIHDAFGWNSSNWRYKEKCCELCKWREKDGGDAVPYGSTTVNLPEYTYCVCPSVSDEEIENICENTNYGENCNYHEFKENE